MFESGVGTARGRRADRSVTFSCLRLLLLLTAASGLLFGCGFYLGYYIFPIGLKQQSSESDIASSSRSKPVTLDVQAAQAQSAKGNSPQILRTCTDTCSKAKNGICDDGRNESTAHSSVSVFCDLGTDCSDCGEWVGPAAPKMDDALGPIAHLLAKGTELRVRRTHTRPSFLMTYTNPQLDLDVSDVLERAGVMEGGITQVFYEVLRNSCVQPDGSQALVLDVGANFGYFSVYAAKLGCRVIAWEPVPLFRAFVQYNLQLNNVSHLVELRGKVVGDKDGADLDMMVPTQGIWGTASVAGINQFIHNVPRAIKVKSERIDSIIKEDVLLAKVDVEGYEPVVFRSLENLFKNHKLENIIMEYNPGVAERMYPMMDLMEDNPAMLMSLLLRDYRIMQLDDNYGKSGHVEYDTGIPPLPEVSLANLRYDMEDVALLKKQKLGCPKPKELEVYAAAQWMQCNQMPEEAHPKSFRSIYPQNTNIWASHSKAQSRALMKQAKLVGVFPLTQDAKSTWVSSSDPEKGVGSRVCFYLEPFMLVRSRCNCTHAVKAGAEQHRQCLAEEELVSRLVKEGKMPLYDFGSS